MACDTSKQALDKLKEEFKGSNKTRQQQLINLRRDFENLKMKESKTIKQYADRIIATVNNVRLLGDEFSDKRIVEKVITTLPKKYESKFSSLEDSRNLSAIRLTKLINALYAQEQTKWKSILREPFRPGAERAQARAQVTKEEQVFTAPYFASSSKVRKNWLINSGCTHYMALDKGMFRELDTSFVSKVRIGNGDFIEAKGKGKAMICTQSSNKTVSEVPFVPNINQNLLSVGQL
ncbi:uncharacterized protein LOC108471933 [Gossypium arboreum]|uniref:uncharacterized protein LOC108471933 n=1 Tax=Gossypium arboreum TaxID=29729 RepID=UPI0008193D09|nr:uncharacterized protein LOC108471933 [Gossypium arboreum]